MPSDKSLPQVKDGRLTKPYPINSLADVSRARVLPPPKMPSRAAEVGHQRGQKIAHDTHKRLSKEKRGPYAPDLEPSGDDRAKGAVDYIQRRNRLMRGVSNRSPKRASSRRA